MKPMTAYALIVGLLLVVGGVILGFVVPVSVVGHAGTVSCGAPWGGSIGTVPSDFSGVYGRQDPSPTNYQAECADQHQGRGLIALVVVVIGAGLAGGAIVSRKHQAVSPLRSESQAS